MTTITTAAITATTTTTKKGWIGDEFGDEGTQYLTESLMKNTTLTFLVMNGHTRQENCISIIENRK